MASNLLPGEEIVRRRGSVQQGHALEILGHAVEYLLDSRMFLSGEGVNDETQSSQDAVQVLMRLSRDVFQECPEVVPLRRRVKQWVAGRVPVGLRRVA